MHQPRALIVTFTQSGNQGTGRTTDKTIIRYRIAMGVRILSHIGDGKETPSYNKCVSQLNSHNFVENSCICPLKYHGLIHDMNSF